MTMSAGCGGGCCSGKYTVPVLWDKKERTIVNNEVRTAPRPRSRSHVTAADGRTCSDAPLLACLMPRLLGSRARMDACVPWLPVSAPQSSEIIRMLNSAFNHLAKNPSLDLYPEALRPAIDAVNEWVYQDVNNGVYRCGFATSQEAYDTAFQ